MPGTVLRFFPAREKESKYRSMPVGSDPGLTWFALRPDPMPRMKLEWLRYSVPVNELEHPVEFTIRNPAWRR